MNLSVDETLNRKSSVHTEKAEGIAKNGRIAFRSIRTSSTKQRNAVLELLSKGLLLPKNQKSVIDANAADLALAKQSGMSSAMMDRLTIDEKRIRAMSDAVLEIAAFPDPVGEIESGRVLANGIEMIKKRVPLGVVFTIYESRPNVTIDVGALCIKSGNSAILRGGKEALNTNLALYAVFSQAVKNGGLPEHAIQILDDTDRDLMLALLKRDDLIDLVVPRGGEALIRYVSHNSRIPVVKHDKGVCTLYVDEHASLESALNIAVNSKLQRPSVCNSIENLIIHKNYAFIPELLQGLKDAGADLSGCGKTLSVFPGIRKIENEDEEYTTEFLDGRLSVKIISDVGEALDFIGRYSSGHSEGIVSNDFAAIESFSKGVDSAAVFINCSTRFHDGGAMGMGAEVGISTGRLHVRGPMGVRDLTTTTYVMKGNGQIRS